MIVAEDAAPGSAEEGENYFVSMTDMMIGVLFIFIIMLMVFALNYRSSTDTLENKRRVAEDQTRHLERASRLAVERARELERAKLTAEDRARQWQDAKRIAEDRARKLDEQGKKLRILQKNAVRVAQSVATRLEELRTEVHREIFELDRAQYTRKKLLEDIKSQLQAEGLNVQIDERSGVLRLTEAAVEFALDSSILEDTPESYARTNVSKIARVLDRVLPAYSACRVIADKHVCSEDLGVTVETVFIEGHTDTTGRDDRNWQLSTERAVNTYREIAATAPRLRSLRNRNMNEIISVSGYSSTRPIAAGNTLDVLARNRRIDLRFVMETDTQNRLREVLDLTEEMQQQIDLLRRLSGS